MLRRSDPSQPRAATGKNLGATHDEHATSDAPAGCGARNDGPAAAARSLYRGQRRAETTTTPRTSAPAPSQPSASAASSEPAEPTEGTPSSVAGGIDAAVDELAPDQYSAEEIPESQITDAIDQVDGIAADVMSKSGVPGMAVAVVHDGEVVFAKGYGVREVGKPETVDENTVFQLASVSKSIGSTVIARAVTDGTVSWSDPVKYLPNFQLADPAVTQAVTIGDLYSHRSGIPGGAGDDLEGIGFTREQILERLRYYPLNPFRITYGYTNFGMTAGGEAVAELPEYRGRVVGQGDLRTAGHDVDQFDLRRLPDATQSDHPAFQRGRRLRAALHPQRRRAITGRRRQFERDRHGQLAEHEPGVRHGRRRAADRPQGPAGRPHVTDQQPGR